MAFLSDEDNCLFLKNSFISFIFTSILDPFSFSLLPFLFNLFIPSTFFSFVTLPPSSSSFFSSFFSSLLPCHSPSLLSSPPLFLNPSIPSTLSSFPAPLPFSPLLLFHIRFFPPTLPFSFTPVLPTSLPQSLHPFLLVSLTHSSTVFTAPSYQYYPHSSELAFLLHSCTPYFFSGTHYTSQHSIFYPTFIFFFLSTYPRWHFPHLAFRVSVQFCSVSSCGSQIAHGLHAIKS